MRRKLQTHKVSESDGYRNATGKHSRIGTGEHSARDYRMHGADRPSREQTEEVPQWTKLS